MAESNREPLTCPCGFYGTSETMGLCSKCYNEHLQRKTAQANGTAISETKSSSVSSAQLSQALGNVMPLPKVESNSLPDKSGAKAEVENESINIHKDEKNEKSKEHCKEEGKDAAVKLAVPTPVTPPKHDMTSDPSSSNAVKRVRENSECDSVADEDKPVQKNKKRCFTCNCKLQPAIREIGKCKCDLVFCQLHRLPEQHDCIYDHKASGRKEARDKMVSPKKHMGTSLKRIDSDS